MMGMVGMVMAVAEDGQSNAALDKEIVSLKQRLDAMEAKLAAVASRPIDKDLIESSKESSLKKGRVFSTFDVELYGYICGEASYDSNSTDDCNQPSFVSPHTGNNTSHFNATAKETRIGVNITGPQIWEGKLSAKLEVDFYKDSTSQGSVPLRMRDAYLKWEKETLAVIVGQKVGSLMAPIGPDSLNFNGLSNQGAKGATHAQIRVTKDFVIEKDKKVETGISLNRPGNSAGGSPHLQALVGYKSKLLCDRDNYIALSGVAGKDRAEVEPNAEEPHQRYARKYSVWAGVLSAIVPINDWLALSGDVYVGQNLGLYSGSLGQRYNNDNANPHSLRTIGGWGQAAIKFTKKLTWNTGIGIDKIKSRDVASYNSNVDGQYMDKNWGLFTNLIYNLTDCIELGVEYSVMETHYKSHGLCRNHRLQTSVSFDF